MSKWEDKYNRYKNGGIDNAISVLAAKGISTKEDKKEYKKLTKIKDRMPQIENIVEYRNKLKDELKQLKDEMEIRKNLEQATDKKEDLEEKITKYQSRYEEINKELKNKDLKEDDRKKLESEKLEISEKMPKAQEERDKAEDTLFKGLGEKRELSAVPKQEMNKRIFETQNKMSKCNLVAKNLLDGLGWEQIDMKLDNWQDKKFTAKDDKMAKDIEEAKKLREEKVNNFELDRDKMIDLNELVNVEENKYNKPALTFADKHPRLAKIGKFFKNIKDRFTKKEESPNKEEIEEIEEIKEEKPEEVKEEKSFKEYIKEIAEKGMDGIASEEKAARQESAKAKLDEMRKANRAAEAKKFGQEYADKSDYRSKDDEEER